MTKAELEEKHIVFQKDDKKTYIGKMFSRIVQKVAGREGFEPPEV